LTLTPDQFSSPISQIYRFTAFVQFVVAFFSLCMYVCVRESVFVYVCVTFVSLCMYVCVRESVYGYGVAMISRLLKIISLFCGI